ncbi:MAG: GAF domain-containing protein [Chloroflexi bacterium]|nr:GAF domain-containing protein [Chloroflexota bacterium]
MDKTEIELELPEARKKIYALEAEAEQTAQRFSALTAELEERVNARTLAAEEQGRVAEARALEANLLRKVAEALNRAVSWQETLEQALAEIMTAFGCRAGWIYMTADDGSMRQVAARGLPPALNLDIRRRTTLCECQRLLLSGEMGQSVNIIHCQRLREAQGDTGGLATHASVPIFHGQRWLGVLNLARAPGQEMHSAEELALLSAVGQQLAVALERARLYAAEQQRTEALTRSNQLIAALSHVAARLERTPDPEQIMAMMAVELEKLTLNFLVMLWEPAEERLVVRYHSIKTHLLALAENLLHTKLIGLPVPKQLILHYDWLFTQKQALFVKDQLAVVKRVISWAPEWAIIRAAQLLGRPSPAPAVYLPLVIEEEVVGVLNIWGPDIDEESVPVFSIFASQVAASLEMAHLHAQVKAQRVEEQEILLHFSWTLVDLTEPQAVMDAAAQTVQRVLQVDLVSVMIPNSERTHLVLTSGIGWGVEMIGRYQVEIALSREGYVFRNGATVQQTDVQSGQPFPCPAELARQGIVSSLAAPLAGESGVLGTLCAHSKVRREFSADEVRLLSLIASQTAQALERIRLFESVQRSEERYRLISGLTSDYAYAFRIDENKKFIREWVTEAFASITGYTTAEMDAAGGWRRLVYPEDRPVMQQHTQRVLANQTDVSEFRIVHRNGEVRWLLDVTRPVWDAEQKRVVRILGAARDITLHKQAEMALRQAEVRYRDLFQTAPVMYVIAHYVAGAPIIAECNQTFLDAVGYPQAEVIGRPLADFYTPDSRRKLGQGGYDQALAGIFGDHERQLLARDGRVLDVLLRAVPETDAHGAVISTRGAFVDVTQRVQLEREHNAIAAIATALRSASSRAEMVPIILEQAANLLNAPRASLAWRDPVTGETVLEALLGRPDVPLGARFPPGVGISGLVIETGQAYVHDNIANEPRFALPDLIDEYRAVACVPLKVPERTLGALWIIRRMPVSEHEVRILAAIADIGANAIHRAELFAQIQEQARQLQQISESFPDGLLLLDGELRVALINPTAQAQLAVLDGRIVGETLIELGGRPIADLLQPPQAMLYHELAFGDPASAIFEVAARPVQMNGAISGWMLVLRDVTQPRQMQERIQSQARLATVGQLAAGIAHDFNNIMGVIVLSVQMLQRNPDEPRRQRHLHTIHEQAHHAANLIRQILDFSRAALIDLQPLELLSFVEGMTEMLKRTLPENIAIEVTHDAPEYVVKADPTRVQQVLMNLSVNARDAMPSGGTLRFALSRWVVVPGQTPPLPEMTEGHWVCVAVSDSGSGIPPATLARIFEPFFTTKEVGKGSGLGLAQVYGIVKQHGGHIGVESEVGVGTIFSVYLPLDGDSDLSIPHARDETAPQQGRGTILLVEDNAAARLAVRDTLELLGYRVLAAANGEEALAIFDEQPDAIDLVLSDMVMPRMGGLELYTALQERRSSVKMMIITGYPLEDGGRSLLQQGIVAWLQKPFSAELLAERLGQVLAERHISHVASP